MKNLLPALCFVLVAMASCRKDQSVPPPDTKVDSTACYSFYYNHFQPGLLIKTTLNHDVTREVDINNDSIADIRFYVWHHFEDSIHSAYGVTAVAMDSIRFIIKSAACGAPCQAPLNAGNIIYVNNATTRELVLKAVSPSSLTDCGCFNTEKYIGFIIKKAEQEYLGWISIVTIDSLSVELQDVAITKCPKQFSIEIGKH